jgi:hypothetical protein
LVSQQIGIDCNELAACGFAVLRLVIHNDQFSVPAWRVERNSGRRGQFVMQTVNAGNPDWPSQRSSSTIPSGQGRRVSCSAIYAKAIPNELLGEKMVSSRLSSPSIGVSCEMTDLVHRA